MRVGHLFAGAGGGLLAAELLGHENVFAVEIDAKRCEMLRFSFPYVHIECCDICRWDARRWIGAIDCIAAGFPCQDISAAGRNGDVYGKRSSLIFDALARTECLKPAVYFLENVTAIRKRGRHHVIRKLVEMGYAWRDGTLAASDVGAPHRRNRWWLLAANARGRELLEQDAADSGCVGHKASWILESAQKKVCETAQYYERDAQILEFFSRTAQLLGTGSINDRDAACIIGLAALSGCWSWLPVVRRRCGMDDGLADRVYDDIASVSATGDGQVPLQAAAAWLLLSQTERGRL